MVAVLARHEKRIRILRLVEIALVVVRLEAIRWLEQSVAGHEETDIIFIKVDPTLDPLRGNPRFEALVQKVLAPKNSRTDAAQR